MVKQNKKTLRLIVIAIIIVIISTNTRCPQKIVISLTNLELTK